MSNPNRRALAWSGGAALAFAVGVAGPALAQGATANQGSTVNQIIVTGRYQVGTNVRTLSEPVSYADLNLTSDAGRDMLRKRVRDTAQHLCDRLGESNAVSTPTIPACVDDAVKNTAEAERTAIANATPR